MKKYLTLTIVVNGSNLNYGDSIGNVSGIKRFFKNGQSYSYIARQALRYDIVRKMNEELGFKKSGVDLKGGVVQFADEATIKDFAEIDLFGYMKTNVGEIKAKAEGKHKDKDKYPSHKRNGVVRISDGVSLEPYRGEVSFNTNADVSSRYHEESKNMIYNNETHHSLYAYTISIELDKIGIDENNDIELEKEEKIKRVVGMLEVVKVLDRCIKGQQSNLAPIFVVGGMTDIASPLFLDKVKTYNTNTGTFINTDIINSKLNTTFMGKKICENVKVGYDTNDDTLLNVDDIECEKLNIDDFFSNIEREVEEYYSV